MCACLQNEREDTRQFSSNLIVVAIFVVVIIVVVRMAGRNQSLQVAKKKKVSIIIVEVRMGWKKPKFASGKKTKKVSVCGCEREREIKQ